MSSNDRLRAGVIGLGWAGRQHMAGYADAADVDLVALAGMETEALQDLGDAYGIPDEHRYPDWRDLIDHEQLDLLSIAAPTTLHAPDSGGSPQCRHARALGKANGRERRHRPAHGGGSRAQ